MGHDLLSLDEALVILARAVPSPLQEAIHADRDDPATDRSLMDGIAVRTKDGLIPRRVIGTLYAGDDPAGVQVETGTCVRIMTGAALPEGADAVVPVEQVEETESGLLPKVQPRPWECVRRRGDQALAGDQLLPQEVFRNSARIGLRAQVGGELKLPLRVVVGVAPTGDELVKDPKPHQIRDSNGPMLAALVHFLGGEARMLSPVPDDPSAIGRFLDELGEIQVLLTSGGVSMGERDYLPQVLMDRAANILFHKICLKPGKPTLAAVMDRRVILCLPGNPVSAYVNALLFLPVILARLEGRTLPNPWRQGFLSARVANPGDRPLLHPCLKRGNELVPLSSRGSADLVRLAQADVCAWIPAGGMTPGETRFLELV